MALNSLSNPGAIINQATQAENLGPDSDAYFSADVETDGPIPGPFSMLSFALVYAGSFDRHYFYRPNDYRRVFYMELKPISDEFEPEALRVNGLDRQRLKSEGHDPTEAMSAAAEWVKAVSGPAHPVLVAYPLSFDWSWLYWYFVRFVRNGSPFAYSRCYDIKTAYAVKASVPIWDASRSHVNPSVKAHHNHTHRAVDDAIAQAEIFANVFEWEGFRGRTFRPPL
jgi:DNA polymerase III epsilon subunit-like protein